MKLTYDVSHFAEANQLIHLVKEEELWIRLNVQEWILGIQEWNKQGTAKTRDYCWLQLGLVKAKSGKRRRHLAVYRNYMCRETAKVYSHGKRINLPKTHWSMF